MESRRVLVVEDTPAVLMSVRAILGAGGFDVVEATNGRAALDLLEEQTFDLVVSDVWMPEMDGIALLKTLRERQIDVPVVIISGGSPQAPLEMTAPLADTFGAHAVLYKPFESAELLEAVNDALSHVD